MTERFQNRYRIASSRLQTWDYASAATYFITICTKNREHYFGEVMNGKMHLSSAGVIADILWYEIRNHAENVELGEFVVMPNHIHGMLILHDVDGDGNMPLINVETRHVLSLPLPSALPGLPLQSPSQSPQSNQSRKTIGRQRFQNQGKNTVSSIIGSYKSAVTKHCHRLGFEFGWQSRFHDHIIRDSQSFERIRDYIAANPALWREDKFYSAWKSFSKE